MAEMNDNEDMEIQRGETFGLVVRWGTEPVIRKLITAISLAFGAPRLSVAAHGLTTGWPCYVTRAKGMTQINVGRIPVEKEDYLSCTVIDAGTVEFNDIDPVDNNGREWPAYIDSGFLCWNTPVDLTGYTSRLSICDRAAKKNEKTAHLWQATTAYAAGQYIILANGYTVLLCRTGGTSGTIQPTDQGLDGTVAWVSVLDFVGPKELYRLTSTSGITIDNTAKTITLSIPATVTAGFAWDKGVYDHEMVSAAGVVKSIRGGRVVVDPEVTT